MIAPNVIRIMHRERSSARGKRGFYIVSWNPATAGYEVLSGPHPGMDAAMAARRIAHDNACALQPVVF
jgi:hypothetical protein